MARTRLEKEIEKMQDSLREMNVLVCRAVQDSMTALKERDTHLARDVITDDEKINELYSYIKERCIQTIALHQPMAKDLRFISISIDVVYNLERIADYADDIAEIVEYITEYPDNPPEIEEMGEIAVRITENACTSFLEKDIERRDSIMRDEERMDELFEQIFPLFKERVNEKPENILLALNMILISKYLERIADHAVNIESRARYAVLGDSAFI